MKKKKKKKIPDNHVHHIFRVRVLMAEPVFLSPQVKRSVIISSKPVYTSCLTSCQTTWEIRKYENL